MSLTQKDADDLLIAAGVLRTSGSRGGYELSERVRHIAQQLREHIEAAKQPPPLPADPAQWLPWGGVVAEGKLYPVPEGTPVDVRFRNGSLAYNLPVGERSASAEYWRYGNEVKHTMSNDIVFWRRTVLKED